VGSRTAVPGADAEARRILGPSARFLAAGASCTVFTDGSRALRLATGPGARLCVQAALQRALHAAGVPVARVLEVGTLPHGRAFCLETRVAGDDAGPSEAGWADLGRALGTLHALPHGGFGVLENREDAFMGTARTPDAGLQTRLTAWPCGTRPLRGQALIQHAPDLAAPLAALKDDLRRVAQKPAALCHTDLHAGQLRWQGGRLAALLDFGDAAVGPPAWDVAGVAYFHGWAAAARAARAAGLPCGGDAALFGLLLALHRAHRAAAQGRPEVRAQATAFARGCLERLGKASG
jgi:aminoglycoside phosphotransferase (APT) family kinase protein